MDATEIARALAAHMLWLKGDPAGSRADLRGADMRGADMRGASLRDADMRGADMRDVDMRGASLRHAILSGANLHGAFGFFDVEPHRVAHVGVAHADGWRVVTGCCRWFTVADARDHWRDNPDALARDYSDAGDDDARG